MKPLTNEDFEKLKEVLNEFEYQTLFETGVKKISGGYANAEYSSHNEDWIYITLKWGVQSDVDNDTHEEDWMISLLDFNGNDKVSGLIRCLIPCN